MKDDFDRRIARAEELSKTYPESSHLLHFYSQIARFQRPIFLDLRSGEQTDVRALVRYVPALIELVERYGPEPMARIANEIIPEEVLVSVWEGAAAVSEEARFFARVLLQPYAEYLASRGDPSVRTAGASCPFCSARPVTGVLRGEGDGGKRSLICSLCATEWQYRRIVCPNCGEEDKEKLPIYKASQMDHVRVEACDTCGAYIKSVDLTRNGHAVPVVDELATVALDIWAEDQGYMKLEPNLLGM
jgi:FdhE protein